MKSTFPEVGALPVIVGVPDPLVDRSGKRVGSAEHWRQRRAEIGALFEFYVYGVMPPAPGNVSATEMSSRPILDGRATHKMYRLSFGPDRRLTINLSLIIPSEASASHPLPVMLNLYRGDQLPEDGLWVDHDVFAPRGYIAACMANDDCDPDNAEHNNGFHPFYPDHDWATLACWAWGMQRCVDWLVTRADVQKDKIAVSGHSRRGKAALLAAAFDERIALAAPTGSGCGGVGLSRAAETAPEAETVAEISRRFPYWFSPRFAQLGQCVQRMPVDQHMLIALMAPRPVITCGGFDDLWANPPGEQASLLAALPVYQMLGAGGLGDALGLHFRPGGHDITREDWSAILDFTDHAMLKKRDARTFGALPF